MLAACAAPAERAQDAAERYGFQQFQLPGGGFQLTAFFKPGRPGNRNALHIYLEGDGSPWETRFRVADDPTPRQPVMLRLMQMDPSPALYLGRPCYFGHARDPGCAPSLWTHRRYGPEVVSSLAAAVGRFLRGHDYPRVALFGHSGGGALAVLLAQRLPQTAVVVTLAGNLDIAAWTKLHGYSPLDGSLNPAEVSPGPFAEFHFLGEKDQNVPAEVFRPIVERRATAHAEVLANADHHCCWDKAWPAILKRIDAPDSLAGSFGAKPGMIQP